MLAAIIMVNHITWISRWLEMLTSRLFIQQLAHTNNSTKTAKLWKLLVTDPLSDCSALSYWPSYWMLMSCSLAAAPTPAVAMWHHLSTLTEFQFKGPVPGNIHGTTEIQIYALSVINNCYNWAPHCLLSRCFFAWLLPRKLKGFPFQGMHLRIIQIDIRRFCT